MNSLESRTGRWFRLTSQDSRFEQGTSGIVVGAAITVVLVFMIIGALYLSSLLKPKTSSCAEMASEAASSTAEGVPRVVLVVGIPGNSTGIETEIRQFVTSALAASAPDTRTVVQVTLVNGNRDYHPTGGAGACVGQDLLVAPAQSDLDSYRTASPEAKGKVENSLRTQYRGQAERVADSVANAVADAPPPDAGDAGAFALWPFVAQVSPERQVRALGSFTVGPDNCLTLADPASKTADGSTLIAERVRRCVGGKELGVARAATVRLTPATSLGLSGPERDAQTAVIEALCRHATQQGCS